VDYLHIEADIAVGAIHVGDRIRDWGRTFGPDDAAPPPWRDEVEPGTSLAACEGPA
jgi:hypothetical protein